MKEDPTLAELAELVRRLAEEQTCHISVNSAHKWMYGADLELMDILLDLD